MLCKPNELIEGLHKFNPESLESPGTMLKIPKHSFRGVAKRSVNNLVGKVGLRVVSSSWGPRGFLDALRRIKSQGIMPSQIVDIGAARGEWTQECRQLFPDADYFLVDPLKENWDFLQKFQQSQPRVNVWLGALGPQPGRLTLHVHGDQSSFLESEYKESDSSSSKVVELRTLDSFLEDQTIQAPDMIKADAQGFELEVLKGAVKCLESTEVLLLEVSYRRIYENSPLAHEAISYVGSKGFRIVDICTYVQRPFDGELAQSDILFAKENSRLFKYEGWSTQRYGGTTPKRRHSGC